MEEFYKVEYTSHDGFGPYEKDSEIFRTMKAAFDFVSEVKCNFWSSVFVSKNGEAKSGDRIAFTKPVQGSVLIGINGLELEEASEMLCGKGFDIPEHIYNDIERAIACEEDFLERYENNVAYTLDHRVGNLYDLIVENF